MSKRIIYIFILLVVSFARPAYAQPSVTITGRVVDATTHTPLDFITVRAFHTRDKPIASAVTDAEGKYKLTVKSEGTIRLFFSSVGYLTKEQSILLRPDQLLLNLKDIALVSDTKLLGEVQISVARKLVVQRPGMLIYNAGNDPANKGGTAADVLRKAPVLSVDPRGNVTMRGSANIKILVDGKYSGQIARSAADALNMMPADIIQSVEIITTPSAKYDAEGAAGVINIITKKGRKEMSGAIELAASNWEQVINPRIAFANKKWSLNANAHLHRLRMKSTSDYTRLNQENGVLATTLNQQIIRNNVAPHGSASASLDFTPDSLNQISFGVTSWFGNWPDNSNQRSSVTDAKGQMIEQYNQEIVSRGKYLGADFNLGYTHKFKRPGQELNLLAQLSPSHDNSRYHSDRFETDNTLLYRELNNSITKNREWTFQADYLQPLGKRNKYSMEAGAKMIRRKVSNNYDVVGSDATQPELLLPIPERTDIFDYKQDVLAAYLIFKLNLPHNWYVEAGTRLERTFLEGNFTSAGNRFSRNFTNLVPTATITKRLTEKQSINISYTKRLTRPYIWDLNPNVNTADPKNIVAGNPALQPEIAHQAELSYSLSLNSGVSINPAIFWKQTNNSIEDIISVRTDGVSVSTKQNLAANRQFGLNLSASFPIRSNWSVNANTNVSRLDFKSAALQIVNEGWGGEFNLNSTYKLPNNISLQAFGSYDTRKITLQGYKTRNYHYSFAAKKEIISPKLTLTLSTVNPFTKSVQQSEVLSSNAFYANSINREFYRTIKFALSWEFGKMFKQSEGKRIRNDDVKGQSKE